VWGFIDYNGNILGNTFYDEVSDWKEDHALVKYKNRFGIIGKDGKYIFNPKYKRPIELLSKSMAKLDDKLTNNTYNGYVIYSNSNKRTRITYEICGRFENGLASIKSTGKYGFINENLEIIIPTKFDMVSDFHNNMAIVQFNSKNGVINMLGDFIIDPIYESIEILTDEFFRIKKGGKWGIIDSKGNIIIQPTYDFINTFLNNSYIVEQNKKQGVIDKNGKWIISPKFDYVYSNDGIHIWMEEGDNYAYIAPNGKMINSSKYAYLGELKNGYIRFSTDGYTMGDSIIFGTYGLMDVNEKVILSSQYSDIGNYSNGLVKVKVGDTINNKPDFNDGYGIVNKIGNYLIIPKYDELKRDENGYYSLRDKMQWELLDSAGKRVIDLISSSPIVIKDEYIYYSTEGFWNGLSNLNEKDKKAVRNLSGNIVILPSYDYISFYSEGLVAVNIGRKWTGDGGIFGKTGYANTQGNVVIPLQFSDGGVFINGRAIVYNEGEGYGVIDTSGKIIIPLKYDLILRYSDSKLALKNNERWFVANNDGYIDETTAFDETLIESENFHHDLPVNEIKIQKGNTILWGLKDKTGKVIIQPQYTDILMPWDKLSENKFIRSKRIPVAIDDGNGNKNWRYIDFSGKEVIVNNYTYADIFSEGLAVIGIEKKYGYIDLNGKVIIKPQFDYAQEFNEGYAAVQINGKWGYVDKTGKIVIEPRFEIAEPFFNGQAIVKPKCYYGFMDLSGIIKINGIFDEAEDFDHGLAKVVIDGKSAYINTKGEIVWKEK